MSVTKYTLALILAFFAASAALAQQPQVIELPGSRADAQPGQAYELGVFGDWSVRCLHTGAQESDPCEMHQLLAGPDGSPTAEVNLFPVDRGEVVAGASIVTPLETLLTQNLRLSIDGGEVKVYPFTLCSRQGCVAQVGFLASELEAMKSGSAAQVTIVPAQAAETAVNLRVSLSGFTAAFEAVKVAMLGN
jgi:invasion protein IalB